ncbi:hypothetical protein LZ24_00942 [Desulfobotulus alkaliphilus]|uniref:Uncharacterized protein n=1 Tax=Desulfobotulus alkaliphilus TaxID=622671 RepID=A0A562RYX7_9BACT|nr:hypothetical protein [Desulfobotulus alkaliphilus]TWI74339.1 hypothetical protein LZ24_00942 [Desulfobotulus alkaliphilus]
MAEFLFPNDTALVTGMNSYYISLKRLIEHYQGEVGCGCVYFRSTSGEALLFFDEKKIMDSVFSDGNGRSTGMAAAELLKASMVVQKYRVSVYGIDANALNYWISLIHAIPMAKPVTLGFDKLLDVLDKENESRPDIGYFRIKGDKKRQLGWVFFQNKRIYGFRLPGDRAPWLGPEDLPDFMERFKGSSKIEVLLGEVESKIEFQSQTAESNKALGLLEELIQHTESIVQGMKGSKKDFQILFRRMCIKWADIYDFLDPFAAELSYKDQALFFESNTGNRELIEGVTRVLFEIIKEADAEKKYHFVFKEWQEKHSEYLSNLEVRFPE